MFSKDRIGIVKTKKKYFQIYSLQQCVMKSTERACVLLFRFISVANHRYGTVHKDHDAVATSLQQIRRENEVAVKLRKNLEHEMVVLEERKQVKYLGRQFTNFLQGKLPQCYNCIAFYSFLSRYDADRDNMLIYLILESH